MSKSDFSKYVILQGIVTYTYTFILEFNVSYNHNSAARIYR